MIKILVLHGPNLNLLGGRETTFYGTATLAEINQTLSDDAAKNQVELCCAQSNSEAELIDLIVTSKKNEIDFIIFNPAAFTHTSIALRDSMLAVAIPFIEVHLSNIYQRETFRHHSYFSDIAVGTIAGLGALGYRLALEAAIALIKKSI